MSQEYQAYTEIDLSNYGFLELSQIAEILELYSSGNGIDDIEPPIRLGYNGNSVTAFIIDSNENVFMPNDGKLEQWFNCGSCGKEGFKESFYNSEKQYNCKECLNQFE